MKGERVREGKTGKRWKGRSEMGTKHQVDRFRILKTLRGQEEIEKDKRENTRMGRSVAFPRALPTARLKVADDSV